MFGLRRRAVCLSSSWAEDRPRLAEVRVETVFSRSSSQPGGVYEEECSGPEQFINNTIQDFLKKNMLTSQIFV